MDKRGLNQGSVEKLKKNRKFQGMRSQEVSRERLEAVEQGRRKASGIIEQEDSRGERKICL